MKVVYQTCCGVDVHKSFLVATIIKTTSGVQPSYQKKRFSTFNNSILEFKKWLLDNSCRDVCMESTGKYWIPVFNLLEDELNVTIANPKWVKAVKGNKDDTKDSKWIGDLFRLGLVPGSYIPCRPIRILREFTRYRYKLTSCRSSEKNRFQNALTVCNVALDSVVSDIFGKSATSVIDYLLQQSDNSINHEEISSRLLRSLKKKSESVIESIEGYQMTESQKYRMRLVHAHMDYITSTISDIDSMIDSLVEPYENAVQLLCTIPGVDRNSAITIISEIGTDMTQFSNSKRLCCWAGLTPGNNESAGKKKSVRITRAGVYLKPALVQVAHAAVKSNKSPYYKAKYERIMKRRGKKHAIIAVARMILTAVYHMLSTGESWNPTDLYKIDMPEPLKNKQKEKAVKQAMKLLIAEGLIKESQLTS
ncbi:MAG TPA: IS110 family transposase [Candidatus Blautia merdigallinarum]|uniref:IS110 family transposase n=1 Tax=Candidatus Blautia merdigallinarum TaxID=2838495 RepID=A0A9D2SK23_9FIRM|nr:IS110 family transposase [Candidatus Blautia merdigallinarum]